MDERNKPYGTRNMSTTKGCLRSLEEAIEDTIPDNVNIPFTCYPVLGAGQITHYLLEGTKSNNTATAKHHTTTSGGDDAMNSMRNNDDDQPPQKSSDFAMMASRAIG